MYFFLNPDYVNNNNNKQLLLLLLLLLICCRLEFLLLGLLVLRPSISSLFITTAYFITKCDSFFITKCDSFITKCDRYYKVRRLLQSAKCIYSSKQSFSSNQVNDQLTYSLLHYRKVQPVTLYELTSR